MDNFNLKKYLAEGSLLKENREVSQGLIDSFIEVVKGQKEYGEEWNLHSRKGTEDYDNLITAAEITIQGTDSDDTTEEELIDAAQEYLLFDLPYYPSFGSKK